MKKLIGFSLCAMVLAAGLVVNAQNGQKQTPFTLTITILEGTSANVQIPLAADKFHLAKAVNWQKSKASEGDQPTLEFTSAEPKTLEVELLADTFETMSEMENRFKLVDTVDLQLKRPPLVSIEGSNLHFKGVVRRHRCTFKSGGPGLPPMGQCRLDLIEASKLQVNPSPGD